MDAEPYRPPAYPISVKGVVLRDGRVLLLRNERDEWELPGGKLETGEAPEDCLVREVREEVGWDVTVAGLLDVWMYHVSPERDVFVVTYGCTTWSTEDPVRSNEHQDVGLFAVGDIGGLTMPEEYERSIRTWRAPQAESRILE